MAEKIRGITIELGGDASGLEKALDGVNGKLNNTQSQLKDVNKLLKLDPTNTELLAQKQKLLGNQIKNTKEKLEKLKEAQETMDQNGVDKNSDQYMALQREIIATETELSNLKKASDETSAAMSGVAQAATKISKSADKVAKATKKISTAAAGALGAIGGLAIKTAKDADELNTLAKQTGFTVEELQKFQYASDLVDVSLDDIVGSARKLKKAVSSDSDELKKLGVKTKNADGTFRDINDIFFDTLEALGQIDNETERDAAAMAVFGRSADELAGIVDDGGQSLKALGDEAQAAGLIMSEDTVSSLNDVNDEIDKLKAKGAAQLAQTGAKALEVLSPILEKVLGFIDGILTKLGELTPEQMQTVMTILAVVAAISPLASLLSKVSGIVAGLPTIIGAVSSALSFLAANPLVLIIAAVAALVVLILTKGDEIKAKLEEIDTWLQDVFAKDWTEVFGPVLGDVVNGLFDLFQIGWDTAKGVLEGIIDFVNDVFSGDWEGAWEAIKSIFDSIISGLAEVFKTPLNYIIGYINSIIDGINWLIGKANSLGSIIGVHIGEVGYIPLLAKGGILEKGSAIVGEAGPELLSMSNGKAVVQPLTGNNQAASTGPVYITVQSVLDGRVIAESTTKYQERAARAHG